MPQHDASSVIWTSSVVAAVVAGLVSIILVMVEGWRERRARRRELLAEGFSACVAYKEFVYRVKRRSGSPEDSRNLADRLSDVQERLSLAEARIDVTVPRASVAFRSLVEATRRVCGKAISRAWEGEPASSDSALTGMDVDLSELDPSAQAFLEVAGRFWV